MSAFSADAFLAGLCAALNGVAAVLMTAGWLSIRRGAEDTHRRLMLAAFGASALFLVFYLTRWAAFEPQRFTGTGLVRTIYFVVLFSHMILAVFVVPMVLRTLYLGWKSRHPAHRRAARWTLPVWLYVSVTGIVVYLMLYAR